MYTELWDKTWADKEKQATILENAAKTLPDWIAGKPADVAEAYPVCHQSRLRNWDSDHDWYVEISLGCLLRPATTPRWQQVALNAKAHSA
ncbi:hypothetical protein NW754_001354 [Fusarium falciforme]|nr:hypothetical protein NW754_001354 [Fusarium falciforme]